ncbi:MAG TPA: hypothetical protein PLD25_32600 [Chloroflexota bacterium]|nr:hypothetical protein [Chloroflexota bacterium]HUM72155.1 hypothetical protein [Chloroflexota bacterium]
MSDKIPYPNHTDSGQLSIWQPLLIGATVLYFFSLYPWWAYLSTSTFDYVIWGAGLDTPEEIVYMWGLVLYPPVIFLSLFLALISCIVHRFRLATFFVLLPVIKIGIVLLLLNVVIPINYRIQIDRAPPHSLMKLLTENNTNSTPALPSGDIYLPPSVMFNDLVRWTDEGVIFQTSMSEKEVLSFYIDTYQKLGYRAVSSNTINRVSLKARNKELCITIFSEEESHRMVIVYRGAHSAICFGLETDF